jgi:hypothetical protein
MINLKRGGRKRSWTNFKTLSQHSPERTDENHENSQDSLSPGLPEYEAGVLTTGPRSWVMDKELTNAGWSNRTLVANGSRLVTNGKWNC